MGWKKWNHRWCNFYVLLYNERIPRRTFGMPITDLLQLQHIGRYLVVKTINIILSRYTCLNFHSLSKIASAYIILKFLDMNFSKMCCVGLLWDMQNVSVISEHSFSAQCYQPRESELWGSRFKQAQANEHSEEKLSLRIILVNTLKCNVKVDQFYHICILMHIRSVLHHRRIYILPNMGLKDT